MLRLRGLMLQVSLYLINQGDTNWRSEKMVDVNLKSAQRIGRLYGGSLFSLAFNIGGLAAGILLATSTAVITSVRWGLLLYPSILSVRGAIGGIFSGRLSTALHLGTIKPQLIDNTEQFTLLVITISFLSLLSGIVLWIYASGFGIVLVGLHIQEIISMFIVMVATMGVSILVLSPVTVFVSFISLRKGLDPDVVTYPIVSTVADVLVTVIYLGIIALQKSTVFMTLVIGFVILFIAVTGKTVWGRRGEKMLTKTVKEFVSVLFFVGILVNIAGSSLDRISRVVADVPHIYTIFPAVIDTVGDVGSIVGSTATTKLGLGTLSSTFSVFKNQASEIGSTWAASLTWFSGYCVITAALFGITAWGTFLAFWARLLLTNVISVAFIVVLASLLAIFTHKKGLDPDNYVIPLVSTLADAITASSLLLAILLIV